MIMERNTTDQSLFDLPQNIPSMLSGMTIVSLNLLALLILAQTKRMNFQIKVMTMNLAVTDFLTGIAIVLDSFLSLALPEYLCRPLMYLYCIGVVVSFMTITGLLLDRVFAIFHPFRYQRFASHEKKFSSVVLVTLWIAGGFLSAVNYIDGFKIYNTAYVAIYRLSRSVYPNDELRSIHLYKKHTSILFKLSAITVSFMLLYTPMIVLNGIAVLNNDLAKSLQGWQRFAGLLILLNSFINPFLFVLRFTECRYTFLSIVCFACKSQREKYKNLKKQFGVSFLDEQSQGNTVDTF
ncbi:melanocortin receptor 5-like [Magallana gigas]|uniref:melanocortin receptor 5-like n=1 Tax=Magallana gigas TaxID=29159 RepID=UPI0033406947